MNGLSPFLEVTLVSVGLSLMISVIYRVTTKPGEMRKAKEDMKFFKEKMKEAQKEGKKEKSNEYASEMLKASQSQFKNTMKPMFATMMIFLLLAGWLHSNYGGISADLGKDPDATFNYGGAEHKIYYAKVEDSGQISMKAGVDFNDDGHFSQDEIFDQNAIFEYKGAHWQVGPLMDGFVLFQTQRENSVHFTMLIAKMPFTLPFLGSYLSWFWWYLFISVPATIVFRKMLGVE